MAVSEPKEWPLVFKRSVVAIYGKFSEGGHESAFRSFEIARVTLARRGYLEPESGAGDGSNLKALKATTKGRKRSSEKKSKDSSYEYSEKKWDAVLSLWRLHHVEVPT